MVPTMPTRNTPIVPAINLDEAMSRFCVALVPSLLVRHTFEMATTAEGDRTQTLALARELRSSSSTRTAVMGGRNVSYIKGNRLVEFLQQHKNKFTPEQAQQVGSALLKLKLVVKADTLDGKKRMLRACNAQDVHFDEKYFYVWNFEGSTGMRNLLLVVIVLAFFGLVLFPVWPQQAKVGVWYVSMTLLLALFGFICVRFVLFLFLYALGMDFWVLPNFFADDLGIVESFRPLYSFHLSKQNLKDTWPYRLAMCGLVVSLVYWIATQPTEFDEFVAQQRQFVDELYEGTLLSDKSQKEKDQIDRLTGGSSGAIPNVADVQRELEELELLSEQEGDEAIDKALEQERDEAIDKALEQEEEEEVADL